MLSLEIPTVVENRAELSAVSLGYPLRFVIQDNSGLSIGVPDSPPFPYPVSLMNPLDNQTRVLWTPLLVNYFVLHGLFFLSVRRYANIARGRAET